MSATVTRRAGSPTPSARSRRPQTSPSRPGSAPSSPAARSDLGGLASHFHRRHAADPVDVALHDVAVEATVGRIGRSRLTSTPGFRRSSKRVRASVSPVRSHSKPARRAHGRQAAAVHRDAPRAQVRERRPRRFGLSACRRAAWRGPHLPGVLDDAREHVGWLRPPGGSPGAAAESLVTTVFCAGGPPTARRQRAGQPGMPELDCGASCQMPQRWQRARRLVDTRSRVVPPKAAGSRVRPEAEARGTARPDRRVARPKETSRAPPRHPRPSAVSPGAQRPQGRARRREPCPRPPAG